MASPAQAIQIVDHEGDDTKSMQKFQVLALVDVLLGVAFTILVIIDAGISYFSGYEIFNFFVGGIFFLGVSAGINGGVMLCLKRRGQCMIVAHLVLHVIRCILGLVLMGYFLVNWFKDDGDSEEEDVDEESEDDEQEETPETAFLVTALLMLVVVCIQIISNIVNMVLVGKDICKPKVVSSPAVVYTQSPVVAGVAPADPALEFKLYPFASPPNTYPSSMYPPGYPCPPPQPMQMPMAMPVMAAMPMQPPTYQSPPPAYGMC